MSTIAFVEKVNSRSGTGRNGKPYTLYSMKLMDETGSSLPGWYNCGFDRPPCQERDYVKLEATPKGDNFDVVKGSIKVSKNPPKAPTSEYEQKRNASGGGGGRAATVKTSELFGQIGGYNTEDDIRRISYMNARSDALRLVDILVSEKALALPAATSKAGAASRFDIITEAVDKLTVQFFFDAATGRKIGDPEGDAAKADGDFKLPSDEGFESQPEDDPVFEDAEAVAETDGFDFE